MFKRKYTNHGDRYTRFYDLWRWMKTRCSNKNNISYKYYGGRGITYDPKWEEYVNFKKDMWYKYTKAVLCQGIKRLSIERINVDGNYTKENCIFIEFNKQNKNRTNNTWFKAISPNGKIYLSKVRTDFAKKHNLYPQSIYKCLVNIMNHHHGWKFKSC